MIRILQRTLLVLMLAVAAVPAPAGTAVTFDHVELDDVHSFRLSNGRLTCTFSVVDGRLEHQRLTMAEQVVLESDGGFAAELVWTGWQGPGMVNNAENPVTLTAADLRLVEHRIDELPGGGRDLHLVFQLGESDFRARLSCRLEPDDFFVRRRLSLADTDDRGHFLHRIWPLSCTARAHGGITVVKPGGFGQPAALTCGDSGGAFFGLEYPAAENSARQSGTEAEVRCGQLLGQRLGPAWVESAWVVQALIPDSHLRIWFDRYLDSVRVAPLRPYTLYNSWYDLRAPEMVEDQANVMNGPNIERIMDSFRRKMIEPYGVGLDAFVLDDGWDVYRSDWLLRDEQFPDGLGPVARALAADGTDLGIWFGPTGGYSHRDWRLENMRANDYELVGDQLCLAGEKYGTLFKQRVTEMVADHGVDYFKWDGIQFSCSEPDHGHPTGLYSRRAVLETVIDLCRSMREKNPGIFLNVTSGTWLSPWWTGHADTIWMQGYDYGYADVPSISRRDRAITYRDCVLYDGLVENDFWFPMANLMTHGIIKGDLQQLGGEAEPLDKFTDNALLYVARGVSMYELYVSPDLLSEGEWGAIAQSILWAKDRFEILDSTVMVGGDPGKREPYGYAHFEDSRGILAVRNPFAEKRILEVAIGPALGLDAGAKDLVLDRVYPTRLIEPALFQSGLTLLLELQGYETAVYELYPLSEAAGPLLAGVIHEVAEQTDEQLTLRCLAAPGEGVLLNPETVRSVTHEGRREDPVEFRLPQLDGSSPAMGSTKLKGGPEAWDVVMEFEAEENDAGNILYLLWEPAEGTEPAISGPVVTATVNGEPRELTVEEQAGRWSWHSLDVGIDPFKVKFHLAPGENGAPVTGKVKACILNGHRPEPRDITLILREPVTFRPMPPSPRPASELWGLYEIGWFDLDWTAKTRFDF